MLHCRVAPPLRSFGQTGVRVPTIGQGTWKLNLEDRAAAVRALRRGLDLGLTHLDTAEMYGRGAVEELVGEALTGRREEVFLVSKVLPENATSASTRRACEASLRRLRTDRLDLYLLHRPGPHPLEATLGAFERLKAAGKILAYGVSNFDVADLERAAAVAGAGALSCNQVLYHLGERTAERAVLPWCERHGVAFVGYSPFAFGGVPSPASPAGQVLGAVAALHGASPPQVALAFLTRRAPLFAIPKAARVEHVEENARAGSLVLSEDTCARLEAAFPVGPARRLPTLQSRARLLRAR